MKPTVVAQDEMFPDGDAGWMEMDEVPFCKLFKYEQKFSAKSFLTMISTKFNLLFCSVLVSLLDRLHQVVEC